MGIDDVLALLGDEASGRSVGNLKKAELRKDPGLYSVFIDDVRLLPFDFREYMAKKMTRMVYIGKATGSIRKRLFDQDLGGHGNATFFRSLGAVLNHTPICGHLRNSVNKSNYRFCESKKVEIVDWAKEHLKVVWVSLPIIDVDTIEPKAIGHYRPALNITHNPDRLEKLIELRAKCRVIACGCDPDY